ncbi:Hypothetical predicted protein, partial [Pelobates cultripes]
TTLDNPRICTCITVPFQYRHREPGEQRDPSRMCLTRIRQSSHSATQQVYTPRHHCLYTSH